MITKGVASVSSPVKNLRESSASIDHDQFCDAVSSEFVKLYGGDGAVQVRLTLSVFALSDLVPQRVDESELGKKQYVCEVHAELKARSYLLKRRPELTRLFRQSWDWMYGQTPEFTHDLTGSFDEGDVVSPARVP